MLASVSVYSAECSFRANPNAFLEREARGIRPKRNFLDVSADIVEKVDPIFFGDPKTAAAKVLGG